MCTDGLPLIGARSPQLAHYTLGSGSKTRRGARCADSRMESVLPLNAAPLSTAVDDLTILRKKWTTPARSDAASKILKPNPARK
jgi:hypothetical protein